MKPDGPVMKIANNGPWLAPGSNSIGPINPRTNEIAPVIKPIFRILEMVLVEKYTNINHMQKHITAAINSDTKLSVVGQTQMGKQRKKSLKEKVKIIGKKISDIIIRLYLLIFILVSIGV
jgi:hypothetical protein